MAVDVVACIVTFLLGSFITWIALGVILCLRFKKPGRRVSDDKTNGSSDAGKAAWSGADVEKGEAALPSPSAKSSNNNNNNSSSSNNNNNSNAQKQVQEPEAASKTHSCLSPRSLQETVRRLVEEELNSKFIVSGKGERDELKHKVLTKLAVPVPIPDDEEVHEVANLRNAACANEAVSRSMATSGSETRTPHSSNRSASSTKSMLPEELAAPPGAAGPPPAPPPMEPAPVMEVGCASSSASCSRQDTDGRLLEFGPTERQLDLSEPPERSFPSVDEEISRNNSVATVTKILHKRDVQTTELHRQLREARQQLWQQTIEARTASSRLHDLLTDPSKAPQAQADALERLKTEASELSHQLADARDQAKQWKTMAKQQRAYLIQEQRIGQEGVMLLKRHPAGEIFLLPPPVPVSMVEDDQSYDGPGWDVGTSHCNPYKVDSWPFEPNVLAQRASREPGLHTFSEGEDEDYEESDEEFEKHFPMPAVARPKEHGRRPVPRADGDDLDWDGDGEDEAGEEVHSDELESEEMSNPSGQNSPQGTTAEASRTPPGPQGSASSGSL
mmetsp:Transcript_96214/g.200993  ORF Transcript_96214/g.200993 Transcript_96214/m.200993 type:complete len:559 (-) Transcript_96214:180-1856(-)|eukprot:CAMPEP_0206546392 /NCGR_PEP_ID=MMETSP0325_2-20121206/12682_1 /ASSEMBLY_ACC=CAM_ASM_000347 /TAXON_ID=2866 /ORGANISM="Crypthecodinium cohnii, Strain Seligo" /LENGTH=558 /DNA_ID=CAMNT_0054045515 /DNA_START=103 /DNA_END=1779 /DNA_ORIENTATION=+